MRGSNRRSWRQVSSPSMPGILTSSNTTSKGIARANTSACSPPDASEVLKPRVCKVVCSARRTDASSSTIRMTPREAVLGEYDEGLSVTLLLGTGEKGIYASHLPITDLLVLKKNSTTPLVPG